MDIAVNQVNALTYSDLPLPGPRVIRLLKLIDEPEISSMPCCSLEVVDLDANPSYEALSYTWVSIFTGGAFRHEGKLIVLMIVKLSWMWALPTALYPGALPSWDRSGFDELLEILFGYQPAGALELAFPTHNRQEAASMILQAFDSGSVGIEGVDPDAIVYYVVERGRTRETARIGSDWRRKQIQKERHDLGVREQSFYPGQLVMLYDAKAAKKKLHPAWRGPFVITGLGGDHGKSYTPWQVNGTSIPRSFHRDHLKPFRPGEGYLITGYEESIPAYQNLRAGRASHKLPHGVKEVPGVWAYSKS